MNLLQTTKTDFEWNNAGEMFKIKTRTKFGKFLDKQYTPFALIIIILAYLIIYPIEFILNFIIYVIKFTLKLFGTNWESFKK